MKTRHRRSNDVDGLVNFPVSNPRYKDSGEGGMAVYLMMEEDPNICIPGVGCFVYAGCAQANLGESEKMGMPPRGNEIDKDDERSGIFWVHGQHATGLLYLGSTGASLWDAEREVYWTAQFADLTEKGRDLYALVHYLYAGAPPKIVTCLDT